MRDWAPARSEGTGRGPTSAASAECGSSGHSSPGGSSRCSARPGSGPAQMVSHPVHPEDQEEVKSVLVVAQDNFLQLEDQQDF